METHLIDTKLVTMSAGGDLNAFGELVSRHQNLVCSVAFGRCGDFSLSEDIAQEAFLQAWKKIGSLKDKEKFLPWLCTIARNLSSKTATRWKRYSGDSVEESCELYGEEMVETAPDPKEQMVKSDDIELVMSSLAKLPEAYRECLILYYREDYSISQVAIALDLSEATARQRLKRGRDLLKAQVNLMLEITLRQSRPSREFTRSVMGAIVVTKEAGGALALSSAALSAGSIIVGGAAVGAFVAQGEIDSAKHQEEKKMIQAYIMKVIVLSAGIAVSFFHLFDMITLFFIDGMESVPWNAKVAILTLYSLISFVGGTVWAQILRRKYNEERKRYHKETKLDEKLRSSQSVSPKVWAILYAASILLLCSPLFLMGFGSLRPIVIGIACVVIGASFYGKKVSKGNAWSVELKRHDIFFQKVGIGVILVFGLYGLFLTFTANSIDIEVVMMRTIAMVLMVAIFHVIRSVSRRMVSKEERLLC